MHDLKAIDMCRQLAEGPPSSHMGILMNTWCESSLTKVGVLMAGHTEAP